MNARILPKSDPSRRSVEGRIRAVGKLATFDLLRFGLVGHLMGGGPALVMAAEYPDRGV